MDELSGVTAQILSVMPSFPDLDALNIWLEQRCIELWAETNHGMLYGHHC